MLTGVANAAYLATTGTPYLSKAALASAMPTKA